MFKNRNGEEINVSYVQAHGNLSMRWGIQRCGFGELYMGENKENGKMMFSTEYMGRNSIKAILCKMVDDGVFTDFEDLVKTVEPLSQQEVNDLYVFAKPDTMYFTLPFYMDVCEDDKEVLELRFNGPDESVIAIYVSLYQAKFISDNVTKKYENERLVAEGQAEEFVIGIDDLDNYLNEEITAQNVEIFSYGNFVQEHGFTSEFIKAEKWTWEIVEKEEHKEISPQMELDFSIIEQSANGNSVSHNVNTSNSAENQTNVKSRFNF